MTGEEKQILEYIKQAFSLRAQELYKPAVEMLYKALALDNDNIEVLYQLGEIYALMHNYSRAAGYLEQVLSKNAEHCESLKLCIEIFKRLNDFEKALLYAEKLYEIKKDSDSLREIIRLTGKLQRTDKLVEFEDLIKEDPSAVFETASALYLNGKIDEAKNFLIKYNNDDFENIKILLGKIYFDENNLEKSREIFSKFSKHTENPEVLNYQGLFALDDMDFTEAVKCFSKASVKAPNNSVYFYNLGNAYFFNGWTEESKKAYAKAIYLTPDNMDYRYSLAYLYYETGDFDKCRKEVDAILSINPEHCPARVLRALILNNNKEFMHAKDILEENLKTNPDDDFTLLSLAKTYAFLDMFEKSEKIVLKVIEKNPENLNYITDLADIYIQEKKYGDALELVDKTLKLNPNYIYGYVVGAKTAYLNSNPDLTKSYAQEAISLDMNCSEGYYYLALVRFDEEDFEEAIECMKRAITYDAANPKYYAAMSRIYRAKNDIKTALEYISEAESIDNSAEYKFMYKELAALNRKK